MKQGRVAWLVVASFVVAAAALGGAPRVANAGEACGSKENPCPLQSYMRKVVGPASAAGDLPALEKSLRVIAANDPGLPNWVKIATDGADAAKKGDAQGAKASCKACHDAYKAAFKEKMRDRPFKG